MILNLRNQLYFNLHFYSVFHKKIRTTKVIPRYEKEASHCFAFKMTDLTLTDECNFWELFERNRILDSNFAYYNTSVTACI